MAFDDKDLGAIFPTRTGVVGTSEESRMLQSVGGANTIRTKIIQNPDGSETMLRTRGGNPEFTVTKKVIPLPTTRTFVFRQLGSSLAVIANRFGSGMKVLVRGLACGVVNYAVGAVRTDTQGGWKDVWRINDLDFKINGKTPAPVTAVVPSYGSTALPYVAAYQTACTGDATRSPLFITHDSSVASIATDGTEKSALSVSVAGDFQVGSSAGIQSSNGSFSFYGATPVYVAYSTDVRQPLSSLRTAWGKISATLVAPWLSEVGADSRYVANPAGGFMDFSAVTVAPCYSTGTQTIVDTSDSTDPDHMTTNVVTTDPHTATPFDLSDKYYSASDLNVHYTGVATVINKVRTQLGTYDVQWLTSPTRKQESVTSSDTTIENVDQTVKITSASLGDLVSVRVQSDVNYAHSSNRVYIGATTISGSEAYTGGSSKHILATSKDFIFADIDEEVYLYALCGVDLALEFTNAAVPTVVLTGGISLKYVLEIRGAIYEFDIASYVWTGTYGDSSAWWPPMTNPSTMADILALLNPAAIYAPMYASQGNCPFVAYTTKAEEAAGATPEIYVDMAILAIQPSRFYPSTQEVIGGVIRFSPFNCFAMLPYYLTGFAPGLGYSAYSSRPPVSTLFPPDQPSKVQFANGIKGVWQSQLGEGFTGYPSMEITRI